MWITVLQFYWRRISVSRTVVVLQVQTAEKRADERENEPNIQKSDHSEDERGGNNRLQSKVLSKFLLSKTQEGITAREIDSISWSDKNWVSWPRARSTRTLKNRVIGIECSKWNTKRPIERRANSPSARDFHWSERTSVDPTTTTDVRSAFRLWRKYADRYSTLSDSPSRPATQRARWSD